MNGSAAPHLGSNTPPQTGNHALWLVPLVGLVVWQVWMTLGLFGARREPATLLDESPLVSGRHPLHLYHGYLGAATFLQRGCLSCYDPSFHAGYPKTPVFDSGSRPAEMALAVTGGKMRPGAYKLAVVFVCAAVPLLLWVGARGLGLSRAAALVTGILGVLVWWGRPCREDLVAGDVDLLLAALLAIAQAGLLIRFHRAPGALVYLGVVISGFLGWFVHPLFMAILLPSFFVYYLGTGARHRLPWHAALFGGLIGAVLANLFWLLDWVRYWWIRVPLRLDTPLLAHRTFRTIWEAPLWGGPGDRGLACGVIIAALTGLGLWNWGGQRTTARMIGLALCALLTLAVAGIAAESVGRLGASRLVVPGLLFAAVPAAHTIASLFGRLRHAASIAGVVAACIAVPCLTGMTGPVSTPNWVDRLRGPEPLEVGLNADRNAIIAFLKKETTGEARVLWEDRRGDRLTSRWTALLPVLTGRSFIGGLDPDAGIEHVSTGLIDQYLAGRSLGEWTDDQLRDYCERYNIGWVVCWTAGSAERFEAWSGAEAVAQLQDEGCGRVFVVRRRVFVFHRRPSFVLTGTAHWLHADARRIVLEDVQPVDGKVVLSLHYQAGLRVTPSRVSIERATDDPDDPIPFVRLRVKDPVARVTITWDRR